MQHSEDRQRHSGKRKRIPMDPRLKQRYPKGKAEMKMTGNLDQNRHNGIFSDPIVENGITTRGEEELK